MLVRLITIFLTVSSCVAFASPRTDSLRVYFQLGNAIIDTGFSGNSMSIDDFGKRLEEVMKSKDSDVRLESVTVAGSVSPEGSSRVNDRLIHRRAEALARLLTTRFSIPDSIIQVVTAGVEWNVLASSVEADLSMPCRNKVVGILRRMAENPEHYNALLEIKHLDSDGSAYRRLVSRHFPPHRMATAYLKFNILPLPDTGADSLNLSEPESKEPPTCASPATDSVPSSPMPATATEPMAEPVARTSKPSASRWIPLALKTNMLYDAAAIPNIGLELILGKGWSVVANWMYAWWSHNIAHRYYRVYGGDLGVRRWFGRHDRQALTGHHIGIYGQMLTYDFEFGGKGYLGDRWTYGAGVEYGYSLPVGRHLNIDFTIGFGYARGEYKKYHPADNCYVWDSTHNLNWFGPTKAEVSLVWYIDGRPSRKGGVR